MKASRDRKTGELLLWAPAPRHNGTPTSRAAAARVERASPNMRDRILAALRDGPLADHGATHEEIARELGIRLDTVKARVHELGVVGQVVALDRTGRTSSGSPATVFMAAAIAHNRGLGLRTDWPKVRADAWKRRALNAEAELARLRAEGK